jgi:DNA invertase Pin-like site-specific DNA recombinase
MLIGYARTSTSDQKAGLEAQLSELAKTGVERVFSEQVSAVGQRRILEEALDFCRDGDTFIVTKLDRLARSVMHLAQIVEKLQRKKVALRVLGLNLDTATPTGKLMINLLGSVAAFEREIMLERQRDGIAAAKLEGKYKGRVPSARRKSSEIKRLAAEGYSMSEIARQLKISRASAYRIARTLDTNNAPSQMP